MANCISKSIYESILKYEYTSKEELLSYTEELNKEESSSNVKDYNYNIEDITKISNDNQIMFAL